jgi:hypothetical protein
VLEVLGGAAVGEVAVIAAQHRPHGALDQDRPNARTLTVRYQPSLTRATVVNLPGGPDVHFVVGNATMKRAQLDIHRSHQAGRCSECGANHMDHWPWCSQYQRPYPCDRAFWSTPEQAANRRSDRVQAAKRQPDTASADQQEPLLPQLDSGIDH